MEFSSLSLSQSMAMTSIASTSLASRSEGLVNFLRGRKSIGWKVEYELGRCIGMGGQGVVYLAEKSGADGLNFPVSIKFFGSERYGSDAAYVQDMSRVAAVANKMARIQHDHLLDVVNFVDIEGIRVMVMEWIDGFDLDHLTSTETMTVLQDRVSPERWRYLNNVVVTPGQAKTRLQPGIAISIIQDCLSAIASLHRSGIIHGDLKPANIMLKKTGSVKIIDLGSAREMDDLRGLRPFTPQYAAPEVLERGAVTAYSDLASLGYVLVEMLSGQTPFPHVTTREELIAAKYGFEAEIPKLLPKEMQESETLMQLVTSLIAPDPANRHTMDQAADLLQLAASNFQRELITGNLDSEYEMEIRLWLEDLPSRIL